MFNSSKHFSADLLAGVVVFLVSLPLCLGIAHASGVDALPGLLAGVIGGVVIASLSGSPLSVSGPAAGLVVIVVEGIAALGGFSPFLLALGLAGILQWSFGMLRGGRFAGYVPSTVIAGMLAAIGLLLITKQIPVALGLSPQATQAVCATCTAPPADGLLADLGLSALGFAGGPDSWFSIIVAGVSLLILVLWGMPALRRCALVRHVPAALVVVLWGVGAALVADGGAVPLPAHMRVALPHFDSFGAFLGGLDRPALDRLSDPAVWRVAVTLALVASLETLLSVEALDRIDPQRRRTPLDRELKAQGVGNLLAGVLGALPLTSVMVRSAANVNAGAHSRLSAIVHGVLLLASVFLFASVLNLIPLACLAAILLHTGYKLANPARFLAMWRQGADRFIPFIATVAGVFLTDLLVGIAIGLGCSVLLLVRASLASALSLTVLGEVYLLRFHKDISFLSKIKLKRQLDRVQDGTALIVDGSGAMFIDPDIHDTLAEFFAAAPARRITVECHHLPGSAPVARGVA